MRLTETERTQIKNAFREVFGDGTIYLFGSRADDSKRGGDIDLYITVEDKENLACKKIDFLVKLKREIGEQKIDVVFDYAQDSLIDKKARSEGVVL